MPSASAWPSGRWRATAWRPNGCCRRTAPGVLLSVAPPHKSRPLEVQIGLTMPLGVTPCATVSEQQWRKRSRTQRQGSHFDAVRLSTDRLLADPVHRYADPTMGLCDGGFFLFAFGGYPDVVLLVEARRQGSSPP